MGFSRERVDKGGFLVDVRLLQGDLRIARASEENDFSISWRLAMKARTESWMRSGLSRASSTKSLYPNMMPTSSAMRCILT